ncbi:hypothetical protein J3A83DRAFT_4095565 [Scleroderma citrinum]
MQIHVRDDAGREQKRSVKRHQFPITAAYAFTDYRSQGQTLQHVIIDIASPPTGGLSLFDLYVALSRSRGRSTIQLLAEDDRLKDQDEMTKHWWEKMGRARRL